MVEIPHVWRFALTLLHNSIHPAMSDHILAMEPKQVENKNINVTVLQVRGNSQEIRGSIYMMQIAKD